MEAKELAKLKEIALPEAISYFPQTPAWYVLFGVIVVLILFFLWKQYKHYQNNKYRRVALTELSKIKSEKTYEEIPELVKRVALAFLDRNEIASLSGETWLEFLNKSYKGNGFSSDAGSLFIDFGYSSQTRIDQYQQGEIKNLINLISEWIKKHNA